MGAAPVIFIALPVDGVYRTVAGFPWSVQWCASCGYSWLWFGVAGATGTAAGLAAAGLTGNIPGEDSGVARRTSVLTGHVWLDSNLDDIQQM